MSNIEWLIRYEREGSTLDFKREQYPKEKYPDLLKDIISMANTPIEGKKYIIIGVKDRPDGSKEFISIPREDLVDQATYQQLVRGNVEPNIDLMYYSHEFDGNLFGVIEIDKCNNPPYMMKKDYRTMKKGDCFIRRGSQQERITRSDLDEILEFKTKNHFNDKISIGFNKELEQLLTVKGIVELKLPSQAAKKKIQSILAERKEDIENGISSHLDNMRRQMSIAEGLLQNVAYENRTTERLEENLKNVNTTYKDHDLYYIGEEKSEKINFVLRNDGTKYLEDVSLELMIPIGSVKVMEGIPDEPKSSYQLISPSIYSNRHLDYPYVTKEGGFYKVQQEIGALKHKQFTEAFNENLRVFFRGESIGESYTWMYTIYAKNLPNPIQGELTVKVI